MFWHHRYSVYNWKYGCVPDISITTTRVDCNDDDYVTVQNNSSEVVNMSVLGGSSLGTIGAGQSADYPNTSSNYTLTASTASCPTDEEFPVEYQTGPGQYPFGFPEVFANVSSVNTTNGLSNGSASVTVTSGAAPFQFEWSNGQTDGGSGVTSSSIENLAPDSYSVDVTSTHGCVYSETVEIAGSTDPQSIADMQIENISIYPNPSDGQFKLSLSETAFSVKAQIIVTDNTGREVYNQAANNLQPTINLTSSSLSKGVYLIRVMEDNLIGLSKVTIN